MLTELLQVFKPSRFEREIIIVHEGEMMPHVAKKWDKKYKWGKAFTNEEQTARLCEVIGVSRVDLKCLRMAVNEDRIRFDLWNGRKLIYTGLELHKKGAWR